MYWITAIMTYGYSLLAAWLGALTARPAAALLGTGVDVHLCTSTQLYTAQTVLGSLTEATFDGYLKVNVPVASIVGPVLLSTNTYAMQGSANWIQTGDATPNVVTGYYITDSSDSIFLGGENFSSPVGMDQAGRFIDLTFVLPIINPAVTGQAN